MTVRQLVEALKQVSDKDEDVYFQNDKNQMFCIEKVYDVKELSETAVVPHVVISNEEII